MKTYRAIRDSVGYKGRRWRKGDIIEVSNSEVPPHHFEKVIGEIKEPVIEPEKPMALSQIHKVNRVPNGFGVKSEDAEVKEYSMRGNMRGRRSSPPPSNEV